MNNFIALAVSAAILSPLTAHSANMPDNVGDVMYTGNIVANSPMWRWTVNDYPTPLNVIQSAATDANGVTTHPLNGVPFIAVKGYLPSYTAPRIAGVADKTELRDQRGEEPTDVKDDGKGAVTYTVAASSKDAAGKTAVGKLRLRSTEIRGRRVIIETETSHGAHTRGVWLDVAGSVYVTPSAPGGSCFAAVGSTRQEGKVTGTFRHPIGGELSETAFASFLEGLDAAHDEGSAAYTNADASARAATLTATCDQPTMGGRNGAGWSTFPYLAGAHVVELTPLELTFNTPVQGAWSSTLTVTAYQM